MLAPLHGVTGYLNRSLERLLANGCIDSYSWEHVLILRALSEFGALSKSTEKKPSDLHISSCLAFYFNVVDLPFDLCGLCVTADTV